MASTVCTLFLVFTFSYISICQGVHYDPTWDSLDKRPIPAWYDEAKFGIFIHWGVFSVPSFGSEWFWHSWASGIKSYVSFMQANYRPDWTYADFASQFTAEFYDPNYWAQIFKAAGAKYIVLISKHHEGFTNWPSTVSFNWNSMAVGPKRDLVGELATAIRKQTGIKFGLYHSLFEWYHPLYLQDKASGFKTRNFVKYKTMPELYELINNYKPDIIWSDGDLGPDTYWNSTGFLAWLYNQSPVKDTVVTNDRWGTGCGCKHGGYWTCKDRFNPGHLMPKKWENCMTIDKGSWGYRRNVQLGSYLTPDKLVHTLIQTVVFGGNLLMNVGPTHDGRILPIFEERLRQIGSWLGVNGEAIYSSKPWTHQNDTVTKNVWYTSRNSTVYAILTEWPTLGNLTLGAPVSQASTQVVLLGYKGGPFVWKPNPGSGIIIDIPPIPFYNMPCDWAWVFKLTNLKLDTRKSTQRALNARLEKYRNDLKDFDWIH